MGDGTANPSISFTASSSKRVSIDDSEKVGLSSRERARRERSSGVRVEEAGSLADFGLAINEILGQVVLRSRLCQRGGVPGERKSLLILIAPVVLI